MTLAEVLASVYQWLLRSGCTFSPAHSRQVNASRFELGVEQLAPEYRHREFLVLAVQYPYSWEVREIQA